MNMAFSNTTLGFYPLAMQAAYKAKGTWPDDAEVVTGEDYALFSGAGNPGFLPHRNEDTGAMEWVAAPTPPPDEITTRNAATLASLISVASDAAFTIQCSAAAGNPRDGDSDRLLALQRYVDQLRDVDLTQPEPDWPPVPDFLNHSAASAV